MSGSSSRASSRSTILEAALRCFLENGYESTSTEAVALRAGVSRRTVFNQFASKSVLFEAAVKRSWGDLTMFAIADDPATSLDPEAGLRRIGNAIADFWERPDTILLARIVIAEGDRFPFLRERYDEFGRRLAKEALSRFLAGLTKRGALSIPDPDLAALQFVGLVKDPLWWPVIVGTQPQPTGEQRRIVIEGAVMMMMMSYAPR